MKDKIHLIGCGILRKEIRFLIEKNGWSMESVFLDSALHVNLEKLSDTLTTTLNKYNNKENIVFYGACHPRIEDTLKKGNAIRTQGQNCVEILLGHDLFMEELSQGAFFLLEDWAKRYEHIVKLTFGDNPKIMREIFQGDRKYILCLRTPCSDDFSVAAKVAGELVGLPIKWMDVTLDHLEQILKNTIDLKKRETACRS